jgi:hypothetical protein
MDPHAIPSTLGIAPRNGRVDLVVLIEASMIRRR